MIVRFHSKALDPVKNLPRARLEELIKTIERALSSFSFLTQNVKKLKNSTHYRLRIGDYRVIFDSDGTVILVILVAHRKDVYR